MLCDTRNSSTGLLNREEKKKKKVLLSAVNSSTLQRLAEGNSSTEECSSREFMHYWSKAEINYKDESYHWNEAVQRKIKDVGGFASLVKNYYVLWYTCPLFTTGKHFRFKMMKASIPLDTCKLWQLLLLELNNLICTSILDLHYF